MVKPKLTVIAHSLVMCSSLVLQPKHIQQNIIEMARKAGITVVSLPLVNEWTQVHPLSVPASDCVGP